jgi:hypothetical protein
MRSYGRSLRCILFTPRSSNVRLGEVVILGDVKIEAIKSVHGPISLPILWFRIKSNLGRENELALFL